MPILAAVSLNCYSRDHVLNVVRILLLAFDLLSVASPCRWVDNHLVHVLSPNIYRNTSEALESFEYITSNGKIICGLCEHLQETVVLPCTILIFNLENKQILYLIEFLFLFLSVCFIKLCAMIFKYVLVRVFFDLFISHNI